MHGIPHRPTKNGGRCLLEVLLGCLYVARHCSSLLRRFVGGTTLLRWDPIQLLGFCPRWMGAQLGENTNRFMMAFRFLKELSHGLSYSEKFQNRPRYPPECQQKRSEYVHWRERFNGESEQTRYEVHEQHPGNGNIYLKVFCWPKGAEIDSQRTSCDAEL